MVEGASVFGHDARVRTMTRIGYDEPANKRIEPMTRSAIGLLFQSDAMGALLVMAHPCRWAVVPTL